MSANVANKQNEASDVSLFLDVLMFELCDVFFQERSGHVVGDARMTRTNQNILLSYVNTNAFYIGPLSLGIKGHVM